MFCRDPSRLVAVSSLAADRRPGSSRSKVRAGDGWRRKTAVALLLQVTPDLPNPAEYEADRHRD
jgi:hypothetical protein